MIGKIMLILLGVFLLILLAAALVPGFIRVSYESGSLRVWIRYAWWSFAVYPASRENKPGDKQDDIKSGTESKKREFKRPNRDQLLYSFDVLSNVLLKACSRTVRKLRVEPLKIHILVAGEDPADTAFLFGKLQALLGGVLPVLHQKVRIREQDIQLFPDFTENRMDCIVDIGIGIRILDLLIIGVFALFGILKWYIGFKKRAEQPDPSMKNDKQVTAVADHDAA